VSPSLIPSAHVHAGHGVLVVSGCHYTTRYSYDNVKVLCWASAAVWFCRAALLVSHRSSHAIVHSQLHRHRRLSQHARRVIPHAIMQPNSSVHLRLRLDLAEGQ